MAGYNIRSIPEQLGHRDLSTTMIYPHILNRAACEVRSPSSTADTQQAAADGILLTKRAAGLRVPRDPATA
jgi:hypothetical protein